MRPEETLLIERCQKGDTSSLDALFRVYEKRAFCYALRLTQQKDDAADIVSEAFIRAINAIDRFKLDSQFLTWLYRIIHNCFIDRKKKRKIEIVDKVQISDNPEQDAVWCQTIDSGKSPLELVEQSDTSNWIHEHLAMLSDTQRRVLSLYYWDGLSYTEISDKLSVPAGTVKSRLNRTRECLRGILSADSTFSEYF